MIKSCIRLADADDRDASARSRRSGIPQPLMPDPTDSTLDESIAIGQASATPLHAEVDAVESIASIESMEAVPPIAFIGDEAEVLPESEQPDSDTVELDADDLAAAPPAVSTFDPAALEALLFSTHHPLTAGRLGELLGLDSTKPVRQAIAGLNDAYVASGRSFRIEQVAGGYQMLTLPQHGELVQRLVQKETDAKLGKAAMETLAIIAYKQPDPAGRRGSHSRGGVR